MEQAMEQLRADLAALRSETGTAIHEVRGGIQKNIGDLERIKPWRGCKHARKEPMMRRSE